MSQEYNFFITKMPKTRIAEYYIGCLDGSVYIDFNSSDSNQIYLKRISFDGYGCCELNNFENKLNVKESNEFIIQMKRGSLDQMMIEELVKKLIKSNKDQLWTDALLEYQLIEKQ